MEFRSEVVNVIMKSVLEKATRQRNVQVLMFVKVQDNKLINTYLWLFNWLLHITFYKKIIHGVNGQNGVDVQSYVELGPDGGQEIAT